MSTQAPEPVPYSEWPYELLLERIQLAATAILSFTNAYMDTPADDTTREDRQNLAEVADLIHQALDRFS